MDGSEYDHAPFFLVRMYRGQRHAYVFPLRGRERTPHCRQMALGVAVVAHSLSDALELASAMLGVSDD